MLKVFKKAAAMMMAGLMMVLTMAPIHAAENGVTMYRLYNPNSGEHFYTKDTSERSTLISCGWWSEGIGWVAPSWSNTPVYRLYNPNAGDHHYTMKADERNHLISVGWRDEGIGWYSDSSRRIPIYRQYNPNAKTGTHNYTPSKEENDHLVSVGWRDEGIGWYAISQPVKFFEAEDAECSPNARPRTAQNYIPTDYYGKTMPQSAVQIYLCGGEGILSFEPNGRYFQVPAYGAYTRLTGEVMAVNSLPGYGVQRPELSTNGDLEIWADNNLIAAYRGVSVRTRSFTIDLNVSGAQMVKLVFKSNSGAKGLKLAFNNLMMH